MNSSIQPPSTASCSSAMTSILNLLPRLAFKSLAAPSTRFDQTLPTLSRFLFPQSLASQHAVPRRFSTLTKAALPDNGLSISPAAYLESLSDEQMEAVTAPLKPTRVIAGPGSGKTRVLTSRIAHLIAHHNMKPWQIVAITFTNKAANEMRERLKHMLGEQSASELFAGTFHSLCYRILRRSLTSLPNTGRSDGWSLYDQDASLAVMYKLVREAHPEWKTSEAREYARKIHSKISKMKNAVSTWHGLSAVDAVNSYYVNFVTGGAALNAAQEATANELSTWFGLYDTAMKSANALDFDDLLGYTTAVLRKDTELREKLRRRWRAICVDEFQDTNSPQYEIVKLLAAPEYESDGVGGSGGGEEGGVQQVKQQVERHLFAVGDPDQAIYGWRGADVRNMRHLFGLHFPNSQVYHLRDNYRSTPNILTAAQAVISRNEDEDRVGLRPKRSVGTPIRVKSVEDAYEEAEVIAAEISALIKSGSCKDKEIAVLVRTHQQARLIEQELVHRGIKYVLVGGVSFWRRVEVQDVLAYLRLAVTLDDDVTLQRVINVPKRGLGDASIEKIKLAAAARGGNISQLLWGRNKPDATAQDDDTESDALPDLKGILSGKAAASLESFRRVVVEMHQAVGTQPLPAALQRIMALVDYLEHVRKGGCGGKDEDIEERLNRLRELVAIAAEYKPGGAPGMAALDEAFAAEDEEENEEEEHLVQEKEEEARLEAARMFLDEAALYSGADEGENVDGVRLLTMHAAKGLEFTVAFVPGCVEGLIPLIHPDNGYTNEELEEETRLFYVSMTRAKRELVLLHARMHAHYGMANRRENKPSRFLRDVLLSGDAAESSSGTHSTNNSGTGNSNYAGRSGNDRYASQDGAKARTSPKAGTSGGAKKSSGTKKEAAEGMVEEGVASKNQRRRAARR